ncbi:MAG: ATP-dependent zinc metalloprotease FtsH [Thermoleophilia bacterium]
MSTDGPSPQDQPPPLRRRRPPPLREHPGWRVHPAPDGRGERPEPRSAFGLRWLAVTVVLLLLNLWIVSTFPRQASRVTVPYAPTFLAQVDAGNVKEVTFRGDAIEGTFTTAVRYPADAKTAATQFSTRQPPPPGDAALIPLLRAKNVAITARAPSSGSTVLTVLLSFGPTLLFVGLLLWMFRRAGAQAGAGGVMGLGRSRARRYDGGGAGRVTFADVAGIDEAKAELTQIVDFLKDPGRYRALGARLPRGVLLTGPPGTGKTLLARAIAGEAGVPFFSMSASEFIEMIVGVGASRVRNLFTEAKQAAPAIIFIDELDAIGRSRTAAMNLGGGSDEREQTLNQILTEMDGFDASAGVIVLGATNRPDVLDPALLRAGRFDRRIAVQPPDRAGRLAILLVHTRGIPLADDADLPGLAQATPGMVGADLASLVNEAALVAATRGRRAVSRADFDDALEKAVLGTARKLVMSERDRERTAYHESGHALVGMLSPLADPVRKISIIPRGTALGVTYAAPDADRYSYGREELLTKIRVALGGRAAEELVYGDITTGAESDIDQLTLIARQMAGRWGMSEAIGPIAVLPPESRAIPGVAEGSPEALRMVDDEARRIIEGQHEEALRLLRDNRGRLDTLTRALLAAESLDEDAAYAAAGLPPRVHPER